MSESNSSMKIAVTNKEEIEGLMKLCTELERFGDQYSPFFPAEDCELVELDIDAEHFPILSRLKQESDNMMEFIIRVFKEFKEIHHWRILFNCLTLLENCADPNSDTLEYNKDITEALELMEKLKNA